MNNRILLLSLFLFSTTFLYSQTLTNITTFPTSPGRNNPCEVPQYGIFELSFQQPVDYGGQNNFDDIAIAVVFTAPSSVQTTIYGFYYNTFADGTSLWKTRFAPHELGIYTYSYTFTHTPTGDFGLGSGAFESVAGDLHGFLYSNPSNIHRWQYTDGTPFYPMGLNDCTSATALTDADGGEADGAFISPIDARDYFKMYGDAGFNMFRTSQENCSPPLSDPSLTQYSVEVAIQFDWYMQLLRENDIRIFYGIFGWLLPYSPEIASSPTIADTDRFMQYCINRWSAYVDIWEIMNESGGSDAWLNARSAYLKANDPYVHPVSTSWERPAVAGIDINSPHIFSGANIADADAYEMTLANTYKPSGKPVIYGERGNSNSTPWFSGSEIKFRLSSWTGFFLETALLHWNTSWATNGAGGSASNMYLGSQERRFLSILNWFVDQVITNDLVVQTFTISDPSLNVYSLSSSKGVAIYINNPISHAIFNTGAALNFTSTVAGTAYWVSPSTGESLGSIPVVVGAQSVAVPDFYGDLAFFSTPTLGDTEPTAMYEIINSQEDGDLDENGVADFAPPAMPFGEAPLGLTFDASRSQDLDGGSLTYEWDFGDGSPIETTALVNHVYSDGSYICKLTVTDDEGNTASHQFVVRATSDVNPDVNDAPTMYPLHRTITVYEGELVQITPYPVDMEMNGGTYAEDAFTTFIQSSLPSGAIFQDITMTWVPTFFWTPSFSQSGTYVVDIESQDAGGLSTGVQSITVHVLERDNQVCATAKVAAQIKVLLGGAYNAGTGEMTTDLGNLIPLEQPYQSAPSSYTGQESVLNIPDDITDWVLVELRDSANPAITLARRAALLRKDGTLVGLDGATAIKFDGVNAGNYYIVVRHRNHLGVMTATSITLN